MTIMPGRITPTWLTWLAAAELPVVVALSPALLFPTPNRMFVLALVPIIWWSIHATGGRVIPWTPMERPLLLLLAMVGVSMAVTEDLVFSLGKVSGVVLGALVFWAIARWLTSTTRLRVAVAVFLGAGALLAVVAILGLDVPNKTPLFGIDIRFPGLIRGLPGAEEGVNPNAVAGCLVLFVPLQLALLFGGGARWWRPAASVSQRRWLMMAQSLLLLFTAGTLLLMRSQGAIAGLLLAGVAALLWTRRTRRVTTVALVIGLGALALNWPRVVDAAFSRGGDRFKYTIDIRAAVWSRAVQTIETAPWTGIGMNQFRRVMARDPLPASFGLSKDSEVPHAHNFLLQAALDLGVPGLMAYLWLWIAAAAALSRVYRSPRAQIDRALAGGLGGGLFAHFAFGMADAIPLGAKVGVLFWMALALTVGLSTTHAVSGDPGRRG